VITSSRFFSILFFATSISSILVCETILSQSPVNIDDIPPLQDMPNRDGLKARFTQGTRNALPKNSKQKLGFSMHFSGGSSGDQRVFGSVPTASNIPLLNTRSGDSLPLASQDLSKPAPQADASLSKKDQSSLHAEVHYSLKTIAFGQLKTLDGLWLQAGLGWQQNREDFSDSSKNSLNIRGQGPRGSLAVFLPVHTGRLRISPGMSAAFTHLQNTASLYAVGDSSTFSSKAEVDPSWVSELKPQIAFGIQLRRIQLEASVGYAVSSQKEKSVQFDSGSQTSGTGTPLVKINNQDIDWTVESDTTRAMHWGFGLRVDL